jgi:hypothetical protein
VIGYKTEYTAFRNTSEFLAPDGETLMNFNTDASIERTSWKLGYIEQFQLGCRPGGFLVFSLNPGVFYERTLSARRYSKEDNMSYNLIREIKPNGFGYTLGFEVRVLTFTFGYKAEQLIRDVLDHRYILNQEVNFASSSELRGLMMHPVMHYIYLGVNLDRFRKPSE